MSDEDDYFRKLDQEAKQKLHQKLEAEKALEEQAERQLLHQHRCGKCGGLMHTEHFRGMPIERCEDCGSVLLDPGELEALAGKDATEVVAAFFSMFGSGRRQ